MKVAFVTDTHEGVRNDLECIRQHQNNFWENVFFPKLKQEGIKEIYHLGDFFDKRQYLSIKTMENVQNVFSRLLEEYDIKMTILLGNHDVLYRNTNDINSVDNYFKNNPRITVINEPTEIGSCLFVPWINRYNLESSMKAIKETKCNFCLGHFEIIGSELHKGEVALDGLNPNDFSHFAEVYSGHFHTRSKNKNINYIGSPFEMTWNDFNDPRGFHIFDTQSGYLEFIEYEESMFFKVEYDSKTNERNWSPYKPESCEGKFIKVIVNSKESHYDFDVWLKKIQSYVPQELQVFDSNVSIDGNDFVIEEMNEALSNIEIISSKIDSLENFDEIKRQKLKEYMNKIYTEAEND